MENRSAYNLWSHTYDEMPNKTRDLEAIAFTVMVKELPFTTVLELGAGTGKNTLWLHQQQKQITVIDFSENMIEKAKAKLPANAVDFIVADLHGKLPVENNCFDLVCCSLVLEHIKGLPELFKKIAATLKPGGYFYIGELHPFKQYTGSKANFEYGNTEVQLDCFTHHLSDYTTAAVEAKLRFIRIEEWFDEGNKSEIPRILSMIFQKL